MSAQAGETDLYSCHDHVQALEEHVGAELFDVVLCNSRYEGDLGGSAGWVKADDKSVTDRRLYCTDLRDEDYPWRHESAKLASTIMDLFYERTGPLGG
jgi:2-phospho-L-lactate transferase/gluconeogenesis factor (CofD/UPF0052 family)